MSEEKINTITYDENWQSVSHTEYPVTSQADFEEADEQVENNVKKKKKDSPKQLLITIQLIICIVIALIAFVIKSFGGDFYNFTREWYYSQLNNSVIFDNSNDFSLDKLFLTATDDEA